MDQFNHPDFNEMARSIFRHIQVTAKTEGENFFHESFRRQGWLDDSLTPWAKRAHDDSGRGILTKSGALNRSIKGRIAGNNIHFATDGNIPYARIHNEGGTITVTLRMKKYFWAMYIRASGRISMRKDGSRRKTKANREISSKAMFYKAMAMKKVGTQIKIPKRQFMGESKTLMRNLENHFFKIIDQHLNGI